MEIKIALEWDYEVGISLNEMYTFRENIENTLQEKNYGASLSQIWVVLTCRPYDFKQRKRFKKDVGRLEYDIILDYYLIKNSPMSEKKALIKQQMADVTEQTVGKYKYEDFNTSDFLLDFKKLLNDIEW